MPDADELLILNDLSAVRGYFHKFYLYPIELK